MNTPVLLIIFNRPETTLRVFEQISVFRPKQLFIAADGPRNDNPIDTELCEGTREITEKIDWECDIKRLYREDNLGCKNGVSSAIDWFFDNVGEGIILEDDCIPSPSFFKFCSQMLDQYRDDSRIMHISGTNLSLGKRYTKYSYYFSQYCFVWGWATWKRSWEKYDVALKNLPELESLKKLVQLSAIHADQERIYKNVSDIKNERVDTWDFQWEYCIRTNHGLSICPETNLIENIGFSDVGGATHTTFHDRRIEKNKALEIEAELKHPPFVLPNHKADNDYFQEFNNSSLLARIKRKLRTLTR